MYKVTRTVSYLNKEIMKHHIKEMEECGWAYVRTNNNTITFTKETAIKYE